MNKNITSKLIICVLLVTFASFMLCACGANADATNEAPNGDKIERTTGTSDISVSDDSDMAIDGDIVTVFLDACKKTNALANRQLSSMVFTKQGTGDTASSETITIDATIFGADSDAGLVSSVSTVQADSTVYPLDIYYKDKVIYFQSGDNRTKESGTLADAIGSVDILYELRGTLTADNILSITSEKNADGNTTISAKFSVIMNSLETTGSGEYIVSADGILISEEVNLSSKNIDGELIGQSIENSLVSYGELVKQPSLPDLTKF